ncbi:MAG: c-type cytochrome, partial [Gammaproteobacteria bacterium]|nr:c-type cytochrome [Gammaproteobacteria bacterium]
RRVRQSGYSGLFIRVFGSDAFADPVRAFDNIAHAIAAFERTAVFGQYTSKFDAVIAGRVGFTELERKGEEVFLQMGCADCHPLRPVGGGTPQPGTDFSYHNIGVPKNPENRFYRMDADLNPAGGDFVDAGLGGVFPEGSKDRADQWGKHKTPSLRNVALTAPYGHNGYFNTLRGVVEFYSTRDLKQCREKQGAPIELSEEQALRDGCWPAPEVAANVDREIRGGGVAMGRMGLAPEEIDAVVAFLKTLTDGWRPSLRF